MTRHIFEHYKRDRDGNYVCDITWWGNVPPNAVLPPPVVPYPPRPEPPPVPRPVPVAKAKPEPVPPRKPRPEPWKPERIKPGRVAQYIDIESESRFQENLVRIAGQRFLKKIRERFPDRTYDQLTEFISPAVLFRHS